MSAHALLARGLRVALLASATGCALLTKADPVEPRYFSPESADGTLGSAGSRSPVRDAGSAPLELQLGRVGGSSYLKERIVYRQGDHELGLYEDRRWSERPEVFLRRALERALFERGGLARTLSGGAPTLTADLVDFEEVRAPRLAGRVRVAFSLHDDRSVRLERTLLVERPVNAGADPAGVAAALGEALGALADEIAGQVIDDLGRTASAQARVVAEPDL